MEYPDDLYYNRAHIWVRVQGSRGTVGVTDFAQREMGEILFADFPEEGSPIEKNDVLGTLESSKTVEIRHAACLVDAFLQDLAAPVLLVEHQLVGILRSVELSHLREDAELAEHAFHAEGTRFVRNDRHDPLADILVLH